MCWERLKSIHQSSQYFRSGGATILTWRLSPSQYYSDISHHTLQFLVLSAKLRRLRPQHGLNDFPLGDGRERVSTFHQVLDKEIGRVPYRKIRVETRSSMGKRESFIDGDSVCHHLQNQARYRFFFWVNFIAEGLSPHGAYAIHTGE